MTSSDLANHMKDVFQKVRRFDRKNMYMPASHLGERMGANRIDEIDPEEVRSVFRTESAGERFLDEAVFLIQNERPLQIGLGLTLAILVLLIGFAVGGGFTAAPADAVATSGGMFISESQAAQYQQMTSDLREARSQISIMEGQAAFHRTQVETFADDSANLRSSLDESRLELALIVTIYEECVERLYPLECIESARPEADTFLAEFYADR